jgi:hypothetical protein
VPFCAPHPTPLTITSTTKHDAILVHRTRCSGPACILQCPRPPRAPAPAPAQVGATTPPTSPRPLAHAAMPPCKRPQRRTAPVDRLTSRHSVSLVSMGACRGLLHRRPSPWECYGAGAVTPLWRRARRTASSGHALPGVSLPSMAPSTEARRCSPVAKARAASSARNKGTATPAAPLP